MESKYLEFELVEQKPKTAVYQVLSKSSDTLGEIKWYPPWRQYCFFPVVSYTYAWNKQGKQSETMESAVFSAGCMLDIVAFIKELMETRKKKTA